MSRKVKVDWVRLENMTPGGSVVRTNCERCGGTDESVTPMPLRAFTKWLVYVMEKHRFCVVKAAEGAEKKI